MPHRRLAALLILGPLALAPSALAHIRLAGEFTMTGRITVDDDVPGEHVGERVTRMWDFLAPCPTGQCRTEKLVRSRATGEDRLTLRRKHGEFSHWVGKGSFYAPLRCGARIYARGEHVSFTIAVRISGVEIVDGMPGAASVQANYVNGRRTNLTPCVAVLGRDAAVYTGKLVSYPVYP